MLTKMTAFLARAPALQGLSLTVGDVGPAPYTAGLWCRGITVLGRRENLLGRVTQRCRAEFTLRLCLPRPGADKAARLLGLQTWAGVSFTHLRAHETGSYLVCRLLLGKKKKKKKAHAVNDFNRLKR